MKLILAIISADAVEPLSHKLTEHKYSVTQISSVGGFLRRGSTTVVIGVDDAMVDDALVVIRNTCSQYSKAEIHAATVFVLDAAQFVQV